MNFQLGGEWLSSGMRNWLRCLGWLVGASLCLAGESYVEVAAMASSHATQAAAADKEFVYAVSSTGIAKHNRATEEWLAVSTGSAVHFNSALLMDGALYAAHSNFPIKPEQGEIWVMDTQTMKLQVLHRFESPPGSLTWAVKHEENWWCHFAHYGKDNRQSALVRYDEKWCETGRWDYPPELIKEWGQMSLSGGIWQDGNLLTTGHDKKSIYRLRIPEHGKTLRWVATLPSPFPGQGIAIDLKTGGLVGIDRSRKMVVFAKLEKEMKK